MSRFFRLLRNFVPVDYDTLLFHEWYKKSACALVTASCNKIQAQKYTAISILLSDKTYQTLRGMKVTFILLRIHGALSRSAQMLH
jgi:hypothetical protein